MTTARSVVRNDDAARELGEIDTRERRSGRVSGDPSTPILNAVRRHPDAAASVVICADDVVNHWRRRYDAPTLSDVAEHMSRLATLLARLTIAVDAMREAERTTRTVAEAEMAQTMRAQVERDDDSAEFESDVSLGRLKLP